MICPLTYDLLQRQEVGHGCPDCSHSPLVHTNESGCSVCLALSAAKTAELWAGDAR